MLAWAVFFSPNILEWEWNYRDNRAIKNEKLMMTQNGWERLSFSLFLTSAYSLLNKERKFE